MGLQIQKAQRGKGASYFVSQNHASPPRKKIEGGQSLAIHIYKIGIHPVALPLHPCLPQGGKAYGTREASARP